MEHPKAAGGGAAAGGTGGGICPACITSAAVAGWLVAPAPMLLHDGVGECCGGPSAVPPPHAHAHALSAGCGDGGGGELAVPMP